MAQKFRVLVAGVGGIGKSRLLAETASPRKDALVIGARPGDELLPGALVARAIARAIESFAPALDEATRADLARWTAPGSDDAPALKSALDQRRLFGSLARAFAASHACGLQLFVVDDLQFADELSVAALHALFGRWLAETAGGACQVLIGVRADELRPAAMALLAMLDGSGRCTRFDLAPLQAADVRALLDDLPLADIDRDALAAALMAQVGGNPAFLLESLKSLWLDGFDGWQPGATLRGVLRPAPRRHPASWATTHRSRPLTGC